MTIATRAVAAARPLLQPDGPSTRPPPYADLRWKEADEAQTNLDVAIELAVGAVLQAETPHCGLVGEEVYTAEPAPGQPTWYLDPVDGTTNLLSRRPDIAVSLGLWQDAQPLAAALWLPCRSMVLSASPEGAWLDGQRLPQRVAPTALRGALVGLPAQRSGPLGLQSLGRLLVQVAESGASIRVTGALAVDLAQMALGELDGRLSFGAKAVDVAAGAFLVEQIGGVVTNLQGERWRPGMPDVVAAATPALHQLLLVMARDQELVGS
jgi:myo-inositol-1(or 4)-monophosphatase